VDDSADADSAVDRWLRPGEVRPDNAIRALKLELEAVSDIAEPAQPGMHRRKRVARVIELRNHGTRP
jgi:hypothetical protein